MTRPKHPRKNTKSALQNPVVLVAIITGVVGIITTFLTVLPNLRNSAAKEESHTPSATIQIQPSFTVLPVERTETFTPAPPTSTAAPTPTITPTPRPASFSCLEGWWLLPGGITYTEEVREGCPFANVPELGFSTSANGFLVTWERFRTTGIFGISVPIPEDAIIHLHVKARDLYNAEFWIGLASTQNPEPNVMILSIDPAAENLMPGSMRVYNNDLVTELVRYPWANLNPNLNSVNKPPFDYDIVFTITGGTVRTQVNSATLESQTVNFPRFLFIGLRKKSASGSSATVNVLVSNLQIEAGK